MCQLQVLLINDRIIKKLLKLKDLTGISMKRLFIFTILFFIMGWAYYVNAQDMIILKDGNVIEAKVLEISPTEIRYKRFDHLEGPTIIIMAADVLSIRYENGRVEVINSSPRPATTTPGIPNIPAFPKAGGASEETKPNPRFNTIGAALGYQGVSAFGFTINGTVSPANYTFFDFNLGLGFNSFAFNGRINFNAYVPFKIGGWYAGAGIGGGYNEILGGVFAGNITTGFILFNWLNIGYTLQIGTFDEIVNHNIAVGYSYRFKSQQNTEKSIDNEAYIPDNYQNRIKNANIVLADNFVVERVIGNVQYGSAGMWTGVKVGDVLNKETLVRTASNSYLVLRDGNNTYTIPSNVYHRIEYIIFMNYFDK